MSEAILRLVQLAEARGLTAEKGDWTKSTVYWVEGLMPADVREAGSADPTLEYFDSAKTPHNPPDEGFIDRPSATAISFLLTARDVDAQN